MKTYTYDEIVEFARQINNKEIKETREILMRKEEGGYSVAHRLAFWHPTWITGNIEILSLIDIWERTVEDILEEKGKM